MMSTRPALLLLTLAMAAMAIAPALSQILGGGLPGFTIPNPFECWKIINGIQGCTQQLMGSFQGLNPKFLPDCCKAIISLPLTCAQWIFPIGLPFGDQVNKICTQSLGAAPPPAS